LPYCSTTNAFITVPLSEELQSPLDEVLVELEHATVPGHRDR
jgi:hypothetical protein